MKRTIGKDESPESSWVMWAVYVSRFKRFMPVGTTEPRYLYHTKKEAKAQCWSTLKCRVVRVLCRPT